MDLSEFLLARIAEDEAVAREAGWLTRGILRDPGRATLWMLEEPVTMGGDRLLVDPTRVLAECEAKRRILDIHSAKPGDPFDFCLGCDGGPSRNDCPNLRALALPYATYSDYRPEWRPQ